MSDLTPRVDAPAPRRRFSLTPAGEMGLRGRDMSEEDQADVLDNLFFEDDRRVPYLWRFGMLMVFSTTIAALGMISDSSAVVIGAMLVAPLMTPLLAMAASVVQGWAPRLWESLLIVAGGAFVGFLTAAAVAAIAGNSLDVALPDELVSRTNPSIIDLAIAAAAGAAGGYVMLRKEASAALPGVGIAVALVPPLAAFGILWQIGEGDLAGEAFLLFLTNLATIVLAAAVVFIAAGFVPHYVFELRSRQVRLGLIAVALVVVAVAIPLAVHTAEVLAQDRLERLVTDTVPKWDSTVEIAGLDASESADRIIVDIDVVGPSEPPPAWRLAELLAEERSKRIDVSVSFRQQTDDAATAS